MNFKSVIKKLKHGVSMHIFFTTAVVFSLLSSLSILVAQKLGGFEVFLFKEPLIAACIAGCVLFFAINAAYSYSWFNKNLDHAEKRDKVLIAIAENSPKLFATLQRLEHDGYPVRMVLEEVDRLEEYEEHLLTRQQKANKLSAGTQGADSNVFSLDLSEVFLKELADLHSGHEVKIISPNAGASMIMRSVENLLLGVPQNMEAYPQGIQLNALPVLNETVPGHYVAPLKTGSGDDLSRIIKCL